MKYIYIFKRKQLNRIKGGKQSIKVKINNGKMHFIFRDDTQERENYKGNKCITYNCHRKMVMASIEF